MMPHTRHTFWTNKCYQRGGGWVVMQLFFTDNRAVHVVFGTLHDVIVRKSCSHFVFLLRIVYRAVHVVFGTLHDVIVRKNCSHFVFLLRIVYSIRVLPFIFGETALLLSHNQRLDQRHPCAPMAPLAVCAWVVGQICTVD